MTVCVNASITGASITVSTDFTAQARFVAQPANMTIDLVPIVIDGAHKLTIEGFDVPAGGFVISNSAPSGNITIAKNYLHDYTGNGVAAFGGVTNSNIKITGNRMSCVSYPADGSPSEPSGYGVYSDAETTNLAITYNTIHGCGNSADGAQLAGVKGGTFANNVVDSLHWNGKGTDPHTDCLMLWGRSSDVLVESNRMFGCTDFLNSPDGTDIRVVNNLLVELDSGNSCLDAHPNGTSGAIHPLRHSYVKNTIWNCSGPGVLFEGGTGPRNGNVLDRNLIQGMTCPKAGMATFATIDRNLFGSPDPCSIQGENTFGFVPKWANTSDPLSAGFYIPTNLPAGRDDVGYRYEPAGHGEAP
jgi:hypothetical protein